ncbi:MAG: hypothetical protein M3O34_04015 [Chloroflexota bacterium]|nr:hypothetical protein [Chloroflexota bacterium]
MLGPPFVRSASAQLASATVGEIMANANAYMGQEVSVVGDVDDILGPRSFTIEDDNVLSVAELPVVSPRPLVGPSGRPLELDPLDDDGFALPSNLLMTGTVHRFDLAAFEERLGLDLDDARWAEWAGQPVLVARSIVRRPQFLGWEAATVDSIVDHSWLYLDKAVTVRGEVSEALGPRAFILEDDDLLFDEEVLVVTTGPILDRQGHMPGVVALVDREAWVTGTVRRFAVADVARELGVDLADEAFAAWEGRPAIIARSVRPAPG